MTIILFKIQISFRSLTLPSCQKSRLADLCLSKPFNIFAKGKDVNFRNATKYHQTFAKSFVKFDIFNMINADIHRCHKFWPLKKQYFSYYTVFSYLQNTNMKRNKNKNMKTNAKTNKLTIFPFACADTRANGVEGVGGGKESYQGEHQHFDAHILPSWYLSRYTLSRWAFFNFQFELSSSPAPCSSSSPCLSIFITFERWPERS